jgi:hypothetical protein
VGGDAVCASTACWGLFATYGGMKCTSGELRRPWPVCEAMASRSSKSGSIPCFRRCAENADRRLILAEVLRPASRWISSERANLVPQSSTIHLYTPSRLCVSFLWRVHDEGSPKAFWQVPMPQVNGLAFELFHYLTPERNS